MKALDFLLNLKQARYFDGSLEAYLDKAIAELEALQQVKSCEGCKYCAKVFSYTYPLCTRDEQSPFQIHNKEVLACRFHKPKEQ